MNCSEVIRERRSIRKYVTDVVIPRRDIEKMLEAAMMAPSACNTRPWEFVVVENDAVKQQIMGAMPYTQMLKTASLAIVVCGRPDLQEGRCNDFWPQDCGAAIENLLLQAKDLGYGTCWCGCYPVMDRVKEMQKILDVTSLPLAVVAVGKPDEAPAARGFFDASRVKYL
ncbi:MAG TPA: nitroreductase family protein [Lachnospiraceae bacterium]|nr:nitroreductase family protein [Lachnospiraceae bacterium]